MTPALIAIALSSPAVAQTAEASPDGFDAHDFYLAPQDGNPRDPVRAIRPGRFMAGDAYGVAALEYADESLRSVREVEAGDLLYIEQRGLIDNLVTANVAAGVAVHENIRIDAAAPLFLYTNAQGDTDPAAIGDMRLSSQLAVVRPGIDDQGLGLGVVPWVTLPTGDATTYRGRESVSGGAMGNASLGVDRVTVFGQLGVGFNPDIDARNIKGRDDLRAAGGVGTLLSDNVGLVAEARMDTPLNPEDIEERSTPVETMLTLRGRTKSGAHWLAGASAGLTRAVGAPEWRAFVGGGFGRAQDPDPDLDGIIGSADLCPDEPEPINGYKDDDGCPDDLASLTVRAFHEGKAIEEAVLKAEGPEGDEYTDMGTLTAYDLMPTTEWAAAGVNACLQGADATVLEEGDNPVDLQLDAVWDSELVFYVRDSAGDLIPARIAWLDADPGVCGPDEVFDTPDGIAEITVGAGKHRVLVSSPGKETRLVIADLPPNTEHPVELTLGDARVHVSADRLTLDERIHFEFDKATIRPVSYSILDEVAATLLDHPEILTVEIEGHADERGTHAYNQGLSDRRAKSVRQYLVSAGVEGDRLRTRAYGETDPAVDGDTEAAYRANRRVQFTILASTDRDEATASGDATNPTDTTTDSDTETR